MKKIEFMMAALIAGCSLCAIGQPAQSNNTGSSTREPSATTASPQGGVTGAALVPASPGAARTPDPGTRLGAGNTGPGIYSSQMARTGDMLTSRTVANPNGETVIQNPGVRNETLPIVKSSNTMSQTNLGASNTGTHNPTNQPNGDTNRPAVSQPGSSSNSGAPR